jgi:hypothetical protein
MRQEEQQGLHILHIEPDDQLSFILSTIQKQPESQLLVLPPLEASGRRAFTRARDFHELRNCRNAQKLSFVIPEKQVRQWARVSGFTLLFSSLDDVMAKLRPFQARIDEKSEETPARPHPSMQLSSPAPHWTTSKSAHVPRKRIMLLVASLCIVTILVGSFLFVTQQSALTQKNTMSTSASNIVGEASFQSSRHYNQDGTSGINDQIQIRLQHLTLPKQGKVYYAWLLSDKGESDANSLLLGALSLHNGSATLTYTDQQQSNLLASFSQLLITEEDAAITPTVPSPDQTTWRYHGLIAQTPDPGDQEHHYSLLDHLRHLLAKDPTLEALGLHGGLDVWQYKNCGKLIEWTQSARDYWGQTDTAFMRRQLIRTLDYLDGTVYVQSDVPPGTPLLVDSTLLRVGLIDVVKNQELPGYFTHIGHHLSSVATAPGSTARQKQLATETTKTLNGIVNLLQQARKIAKTLLAMSDAQLHQQDARTMLDDLANLANDAYVGNQQQQGSVWLHQQIEQLATFEVKAV